MTVAPRINDICAAALAYAELGWRVLPVVPRGKKPILDDWVKRATLDAGQIRAWWAETPDANVGLVCDQLFGFALDIDDPAAIDFLPTLPVTLESRTPSGGRHIVFRHPPGITLTNSNARLMAWLKSRGYQPGKRRVDVRGLGGQIVVEPSVTPAGRYAWVDQDVPIAQAPPELLEALQYEPPRPRLEVVRVEPDVGAYERKAAEERARDLAGTGKGHRGSALFAAAARLGEIGLSLAETESYLLPACQQNGLIGVDGMAHVRRELERGWRKGHADQKAKPARAAGVAVPHVDRMPEPAALDGEAQNDDADEAVVAQVVDEAAPKRRGPRWVRVNSETGRPVMCVENVQAMLDHHAIRVGFNLMSHRVEVTTPGSFVAERRATIGYARIRSLAREYGLPYGGPLEDALEEIVALNPYHPVAEWIGARPWDGVERLGKLFSTLTLDPEFAANGDRVDRALRTFTVWMMTAARAAMVPADAREGVASQGVLVLVGVQGARKTRWIMSLAPQSQGWTAEGMHIDPSNRDHVMRCTEFWIVELGEIDATMRKSDVAAFKAFATARSDTYRRAYGRENETVPRRTVFAGSVNDPRFLVDDTGGRRFWILPIVAADPEHGIDMQQVWAEAWSKAQTEPLYLSAEDEADIAETNRAHEIDDPIADAAAKAWVADPLGVMWVDLDEIKRAIDRDRSWTMTESRHLARSLRTRLKAKERKVKGYTQYAVVRRE